MLAHDVVLQRHNYRPVIDYIHRGGGFIILDNSLIELGEPVSFEVMREAVSIVQPSCIVLPDKLGDKDATITMSRGASKLWNELHVPFMAVPQGQTLDELAECAQVLAAIQGVMYFGLPRFFTSTTGTRRNAVSLLRRFLPKIPIHLLGFSDNVIDDIYCARMEGVMGIDSAAPIRAGYHNIDFVSQYFDIKAPPPRGDFWETKALPSTLVLSNLEMVRRAVGDTDVSVFQR